MSCTEFKFQQGTGLFPFLKNSPEQTTCSGSRPPCCPQWATNFVLPEPEISHLWERKGKFKYCTLL